VCVLVCEPKMVRHTHPRSQGSHVSQAPPRLMGKRRCTICAALSPTLAARDVLGLICLLWRMTLLAHSR
jgi:hypothetical protein